MPKLKGGGICVFVRAYNDLDHITPILYKIRKLYPLLNIDMIISDHRINLLDDYRILFLKKINIKATTLSELGLIGNKFQILYFFAKKTTLNKSKYNPSRLCFRVIMKIIDNMVKRNKVKLDINDFINNNFQLSPKVFLFDQSRIIFYEKICAFAKTNQIPTVAVPHGHTLLLNQLHGDKYMQFQENKHPFDLKAKSPFNFTIFENEIIRNRYISYGTVSEKNTLAIGSSRFSDEWMEIIQELIQVQDIRFGKNKKLKIVLMLSKIAYNGFYNEIERTIKFITKFPDIFLIVKPHTRNKSIELKNKDNLFIDNRHEFHSTNLIDWCDLMIFEHSCISFHALKRDKPTLYLSSTHANRLMSEPYFTSWEAKTRDEIRFTIWRMLEDQNYRTYKKQDAEAYIKDIIEPKGKDVLKEYANFIFSLV